MSVTFAGDDTIVVPPADSVFADPDTVALRPSDDVVLQARGLSVSFGGIKAVADVSFDLVRGEILGVVGPNGAGKTTMFDAISGFVSSSGNLTLDGADLAPLSPEGRSRARLGRSFQDARLFPSLTVFETLNLSLERHLKIQDPVSTALTLPWVRRSERESATKATELIERMGLGAFRDKFISELSTGSRRIVDLACIIAHDPLVLLLDEPSSGIAQREAEALGPLLVQLRSETGVSIIIIEHDMPLLTSVSDRLLALETGQVLTAGPIHEVMSDPRLVAAYLGNDTAAIHRSGGGRAAPAPSAPEAGEPAVITNASPNGHEADEPPPAAPRRANARRQLVAAPEPVSANGHGAATSNGATPSKRRATKKAAPAKKKAAPARKRAAKKAAPAKKKAAPAKKKAAPVRKRAVKKAAPAKKRATKKRAAPAKKRAAKKAAPAKAVRAPAKKRAPRRN